MPTHGESGDETGGRAERSELYQRDGDLGDDLAALETRYGSTHRTELARARFKHRVK